MRRFPTREVLDIVWMDSEGQDIRKGVLAYALFADPAKREPAFPLDVWPVETQYESTRLTSVDEREDYVVISWTILPRQWPRSENWCLTIERTLLALADGEAVAAWCGLENTFARPPQLFDPDDMEDEVWAAMVPGRFVCRARLDALYTPLDRTEMVEFQEAARRRFAETRRPN